MTYRCGIGAGIPGMEPGPPRLTCNGCGKVFEFTFRGAPPEWFIKGKAPKGWSTIRNDDCTRTDYCSSCKKSGEGV